MLEWFLGHPNIYFRACLVEEDHSLVSFCLDFYYSFDQH